MLGLVCAVLLPIAGAALYIRVADPFKPQVRWCAGVGLLGPPGSSPDEALAAFLTARDGQPPASEWRRRGLDYENKTYDHSGGYGLRSVQVSQGGNDWPPGEPYTADQWSVEGGCV